MLVSVPWHPVSPLHERGGRGDRRRGSSVSPALPLSGFPAGFSRLSVMEFTVLGGSLFC